MHEDLKKIPQAKRPLHLSVFPDGLVYFRQPRLLWRFVFMLVPIFASSSWHYVHTKDTGGSFVILFLGGIFSCFLFVILCSGFISSNTGTYFRDKEPIRYWRDVSLLLLVYAAISICGYFRQ